jgi:CHASE2 domain-containing sensor protein
MTAYAKEKNLASLASQVATFSNEELLIRYSGDQQGSHRIQLSASKLLELSQDWKPDASPIEGRIVLLGGAYLGQDQHKTPIGQINGVEILANVIETELHGPVPSAPRRIDLYLLDLFEAFGLILMFHFWPFRTAIFRSVVLIPLVAALFSFGVYADFAHFGQFFVVLVGLLIYELYEHFRRDQFPHLITEKKSRHH